MYDAVATTVGTAVAFLLVPMRSLGGDGWKIAAALMGRHIGGGNVTSSVFLEMYDVFLWRCMMFFSETVGNI